MSQPFLNFELNQRQDFETGKGNDERVFTIEANVLLIDDGIGHETSVTDGEDSFIVSVGLRPHQ